MTATEVAGSEVTEVLDAIERVRPAIEAHRDEGERDRRLPVAIIEAMRDAGLLSLWTPGDYGGKEVGLLQLMTAVEGVSAIDGASGFVLANLSGNSAQTAFLAPESAAGLYDGDPDTVMAGVVAPRGRATPVEGGYRVSGRWPLASGSHHASWLPSNALVFDGDVPRMGHDGAPDFTIMFLRAADCEILDTWDSLGLRGTGSTDFVATDVFVPEDRTFSLFTTAPQTSGALYRAGIMALFGFALSSVFVGIAREAIDELIDLAKVKTPTLSQTGLAVRPTLHAEVAKAQALVQSARAYLHETAREFTAAIEDGQPISDDLEARRRLACVNAGTACTEAVDRVFALAGATPIYSGHRLERCLRDIHTANQHLLVSPVWWEKTGQYYLGLGLGMP